MDDQRDLTFTVTRQHHNTFDTGRSLIAYDQLVLLRQLEDGPTDYETAGRDLESIRRYPGLGTQRGLITPCLQQVIA
jgi:hypothetical protein